MASSSMDTNVSYDYEVFLSFRGDDTRNKFTGYLADALRSNGIKVFIDENIERGEEITTTIERVIESVKLSIIVFSPDYASSTFCLDELVKIMECRKTKGQIVFPIFYEMEPSHDAYREAFAKHEAKFKGKKRCRGETIMEQLKIWESAVSEAFDLKGLHIDGKSKEIDEVKKITGEVLEKLNRISRCKPVGLTIPCKSMIGKKADKVFQQVKEWLMNDDISIVGIRGMGGVGKTTIAKRINNEMCGGGAFTHVYWVTVSKDLKIWELQNKIATEIKLNLSKEDEQLKAAELCNKLENQRFLLILDDLWEQFKLEDVGIPTLKNGKKILLTSRIHRVCQQMECKSIEMNPLSQQDAWDLFMKESKLKIDDSPDWKKIVDGILAKCACLPLAIVVIAGTRKGDTDIEIWRNTLRELEKPCEGENQEMEDKVFKVLRFSYDHLKNSKLQHCFLYCSLFPEDYEIKRDKLITYLIGEGIVNHLESREAELDKGHCMIKKLIHASLLQEVTSYAEKPAVKMHDVIRDMAHMVIEENSKAQDGLGEIESCVNLGSVWGYSRSETSNTISDANHSRITNLNFRCDDMEKLPSDCFDDMQNLVILRTQCTISSRSISHLVNLRVLFLDYLSSEEDIPSLMASLKNLKNLRHLELSVWNDNGTIREGIEELINLKVLKISFRGQFFLFGGL